MSDETTPVEGTETQLPAVAENTEEPVAALPAEAEPAAEPAPDAADTETAQAPAPAEPVAETPAETTPVAEAEATPIAEAAPVEPAPVPAEEAPARKPRARAPKAAPVEEAPAPAPAVPDTVDFGTAAAEHRTRGRRKLRVGKVISNKMQKTVVVAVESKMRHPLYGKIMRRTTKFKAHDEHSQCGEGDTVEIVESRPLSREKRWRVARVIEKAK